MAGLIVHEWLEKAGGAENVVDAVAQLFPEAPIACLWNDAPLRYDAGRVKESALARGPFRGRKALALPTMPVVWNSFSSEPDPDWVFVSSHLFAHHADFGTRRRGVPKFVYVHTPARYIWVPELDKRGGSLAVRSAASLLRPVDRRAAQRNQNVAANSEYVRARIAQSWNMDARVLYPPVETTEISAVEVWRTQLVHEDEVLLETLPSDFILGASRFVSYKDLDLVIAAGQAIDVPVVICGAGPQEAELRAVASAASVPVHFVISPSTALLRHLFQTAVAYIFPPVEDFGIMPVEAMAAGARVLVNHVGGASESVEDGISGVHIDPNDTTQLADAIDRAARLQKTNIRTRASCFGRETFERSLLDWMEL